MDKFTPMLTAVATSLLLAGCATINNQSNGGSWKEMFSTSEQSPEYVDKLSRGLYATVGIGPSRLEPDTSELANWDPNDRVEPAGQITIGADISKHLAIEAHSADLGSAGLSPSGRINYHVNGASALIYAGGNRDRYRRQGLTAFGRVGVGALDNTPVGDVPYEQTNATHLLFGAGIEYMTPIGVGLRAEGFSFDKDAKYAQLALMYRTGRKQEIRKPKLAEAPVAPPAPVVQREPVIAAAVPPPAPVVNPCKGVQGAMDAVSFHNDSAGLTIDSTHVLDAVARTLRKCPAVQIDIAAHTDSRGSYDYNQSLSERRAQAVVNYLSARGLDREQFNASAFGETQPIESNNSASGRAKNRRVEIYTR